MPRPATGSVSVRDRAKGRYYILRFTAYGKRRFLTLGTDAEGWTFQKAEDELQNVLADVRRGIWQPPAPAPVVEPETTVDPTFHEFASEWLEARTPDLRESTVQAYTHELSNHLLPFFARHTLTQITVAEVDRYREHKLRQAKRQRETITAWEQTRAALKPGEKCPPRPSAGLTASSYINTTITRLGSILDVAEERGLIARNPVRVNPKRRKAKAIRSRRAYLDRPVQIEALLDAAGRMDRDAVVRVGRDSCLRRPLIAILLFAGLRISEALSLKWRDVDLAAGRLRVTDSKTDAGVRWVPIVPALRSELLSRKMSTRYGGVDDLVFCTTTGRKLSRDNTRTRILGRARQNADEALIAADQVPLPQALTQHSLRHTYISLRVALGDDLAVISRDAGHSDIAVTFRIYSHVMSLADDDRARLRALVGGVECVPSGANEGDGTTEGVFQMAAGSEKDSR